MSFDYDKLEVWEVSMNLVVEVYRISNCLPDEERYGLQSQMRRAAVSIPSNIAEGKGRSTSRDYRSFLIRARSSLSELRTQMELCRRLTYVEEPEAKSFEDQAFRLSKMLASLIRSIS